MSRSTSPRLPKTWGKKNKRVGKNNGRNNLVSKVSKGRSVKVKLDEEIREWARDTAVLLEPQSQFNKCIIGVSGTNVIVYSSQDCIQSFVELGMSDDDAVEYFHYNTIRAMEYVKEEDRPIFVFAERPTKG